MWRSLPGGSIGTALAMWVVDDSADAIALYQPAGAARKQRTGKRGGPNGRNMLPGGWDGGYQDSPFPGPSVVRLHVPGAPFSVIRQWSEEHGFVGWYVNLERPWTRSSVGFDSIDHVLDIRVSDDLATWTWKDVDELGWSVEVGKVSVDEAAEIRRAGDSVVALVADRTWPFQEAAWARFAPEPGWGLPKLPDQWATRS